jgi:hypothetical protein
MHCIWEPIEMFYSFSLIIKHANTVRIVRSSLETTVSTCSLQSIKIQSFGAIATQKIQVATKKQAKKF